MKRTLEILEGSKPTQKPARLSRMTGPLGRTVLVLGAAAVSLSAPMPPASAESSDYPYHHGQYYASSSYWVDENGNGRRDGGEQYSPLGFVYRNCTDYVVYRVKALGGNMANWTGGGRFGNAKNWDDNARTIGWTVSSTPAPHTIAVWEAGKYGHVAFVESVNADGTVNVSEMNYRIPGGYGERSGVRADSYIHVPGISTDSPTSTSSYVGHIVRRPDGHASLLKADLKRYWIPSGGDWQALINNGAKVINLSHSDYNAIASGEGTATAMRVDDPSLLGPSKWWWPASGTAYDNDYHYTYPSWQAQSATNVAQWSFRLPSPGVYRITAFIPTGKATANVGYEVIQGGKVVANFRINQRNHASYTKAGDVQLSAGDVTVRVRDNNSHSGVIAADMVELLPIR